MVKVAVVDLETTGPQFQKDDKIIQIGAVIIENGKMLHKYSMFINPKRPIPANITQLTGIKNQDVINAPTFKQVAKLWYERLKDCIFVAHNLNFDLKCLQYAFQEIDESFNPQAVDSEILSKIFLPEAFGYNLFDLAQYLDLLYYNGHDALSDALITSKIMHIIAKKYLQLNPNIQDKIRQTIIGIEFNQSYFFDHAEIFCLDEMSGEQSPPLSVVKNRQKEFLANINLPILAKTAFNDKKKIQYINYPFYRYPKKFVADSVNQLMNDKTGYWLSLPHVEDVYQIKKNLTDSKKYESATLVEYLSPHYFIHYEAFEYLCDVQHRLPLNHVQHIQLAAVQYWLSYTKKGLYLEINERFHIHDLIKEYAGQLYQMNNHYFFQQMLKNIHKADVVISINFSTIQLMNKAFINQETLSSFNLIISDFHQFQGRYQHYFEINFPISDYFIFFHQLLDNITIKHLKAQISHSLFKLDQFLTEIEAYSKFNEANVTTSHQTYISYFNQNDDLYKEKFIAIIQAVKKTFSLMMFYDYLFSEEIMSRVQRFMKQLSLFDKIEEPTFALIRAKVVNKYPYRWEIKVRPRQLSQAFYQQLGIFNVMYLFRQAYPSSLGKLSQLNGGIPEDCYNVQLTNETQTNKYPLYLPLAYRSSNEYAIFDEYIQDHHESLSSHIILIMPNTQSCHRVYQLFSDKMMHLGYSMYTKGITGSTKKSFRQFVQAQQSMLILVKSSMFKLPLESFDKTCDLFIHDLPFKSLDHYEVQLLEDQLKDLHIQYSMMDDILLPLMVKDLFALLTYFEESTILNKAVIFDERLFTKAYSFHLREWLSTHIEFIMEE